MKLISSIEELINNIETVENYLVAENDDDRAEILGYIKRGTCFVAYEIEKEIRFVPSRFIGYENNTLDKHYNAYDIDGRITNRIISSKSILGKKEQVDQNLEEQYKIYCYNLSIDVYNKKRKYWKITLPTDFQENLDMQDGFPEGKVIERIHKSRERNNQVIQKAKEIFKIKNSKLYCQACGFDFEEKYGDIGKDFIEGHHIIPVSEMKIGHRTKIEDIALLCSNCHRMVHKKRPWLSMNELKNLIKNIDTKK